MKKILFVLFLFFVTTSCRPAERKVVYENFQIGEISAEGWIRNQMIRDMHSGNMAELDQIKRLGPPFSDNDKRGYGEFEGNYYDGIVRNAILTGDKEYLEKAARLSDFIISHKDPATGYMGRKPVPRSFDEILSNPSFLFGQACYLRGLIPFAEYTGDEKQMDAIIANVDFIISLFGRDDNYFNGLTPEEGGARAHGLMFVDVLEALYRITGQRKYAIFALRLYDDYSNGTNMANMDHQRKNLEDRHLPFVFHAPHVAEHSRVVFFANAYADGYENLYANNITKLLNALSPSGGLVTDGKSLEQVGGRYGDPDLRYEYCSLTESSISLESALQKSGNPVLAEEVENIVFNAGQAARFANGKACAYLSKDNQIESSGEYDKTSFRFQYAACHRIACCVYNQCRLMPYYVQNMWLRDASSTAIVAMNYGPSSLNTEIAGKRVSLKQETMYPFENDISVKFSLESPMKFPFRFRVPSWADEVKVRLNGNEVECQPDKSRMSSIMRTWNEGDVLDISFVTNARIAASYNNEFYFKYGALLYAMKFNEKNVTVREFPGSELKNYNVYPVEKSAAEIYNGIKLGNGFINKFYSDKSLVRFRYNTAASPDYPFDMPYSSMNLHMSYKDEDVDVTLVPIGSTVLRRTTFH